MKFPQLGPAFLVTAAFIGPGTVITASLAGANFGYSLIWALLFSVFASLVLQEMAARLGIVTQQGLGENIRVALTNPIISGHKLALPNPVKISFGNKLVKPSPAPAILPL
jgi:NRAMP (natural resistance-associated macrophage protein)-like metal ion transporter